MVNAPDSPRAARASGHVALHEATSHFQGCFVIWRLRGHVQAPIFHHLSLGRILFGVKPLFAAPSFARVVTELASGIFLYDLLFYPFHYSFHAAPWAPWKKQAMKLMTGMGRR